MKIGSTITAELYQGFDTLADKVRDFGFEQIGKAVTENLDFDDRLLRDGERVGIENAEQRDLLEALIDQVRRETKGDKDAILTAFLATRRAGGDDAQSRQALTVISQFVGATGADAGQTGALVGQLIASGRSLEEITEILAGLERQRAANGSLDTGQVFGVLDGLPKELRASLGESPDALLSATALLQALGRNQSAGEAEAAFKTLATTFQDEGVRQNLEGLMIDLPEAGQPLDLAALVEQIIEKTGGDTRQIKALLGDKAFKALEPILTDALANGGKASFLAQQRTAGGDAATLKDAADRQAEAFGRSIDTLVRDASETFDTMSEGFVEAVTGAFNNLDPDTRQGTSSTTLIGGTVLATVLGSAAARKFGGPALAKLIKGFTSAAPAATAAAGRAAPAAAGATSRVAQVSEGLSKAAKGFAATGPGSAALKVAAPVLTVAKGVTKALGPLAAPLTVGFAAVESVQALSDDTLTASQKGERVGEATGGAAGGVAGLQAGLTLGLATAPLAGPAAVVTVPALALAGFFGGSLLGSEFGSAFGEFIGGVLEDEEQQARQPAPVQVINPPEVNPSRFLGTVRLVLGFDQDGLLKLISILGQDRIFWCGRAGVFSGLAL